MYVQLYSYLAVFILYAIVYLAASTQCQRHFFFNFYFVINFHPLSTTPVLNFSRTMIPSLN